ncbi:sucrose phosphorylase [Mediterraneibacter sp. NSJ-55]|uniref:Sucrose 6(F)-phosphate phosphorylase n=1 Tax=Mediterraneibacter hominis TaxID=2763054 RepID=A0A923LKF0_9FIRM|nr:sucrose phosphorylase [Mediterraneibacter hominis]MBC5689586.1 sucrose phosphorylase [Mediterraneibacter hominis]
MKKIENKIMLITYADSMSANLKELDEILHTYFTDCIGGLHVLPFYPSSGDRGFAVINYDMVDPAFGNWDDIDRLADTYYMMADFMLNHISIRSAEFKDYMEHGENSPFRDMFIHWEEFWPDGNPTEAQYNKLYRRKANYPYIAFTRKDGTIVHLWNTFFEEQIDIDPYSKATQEYYARNLGTLSKHVPLIRFDAFAYASKRPGTSCFFVEPEIWEVLDIGMEPLRKTGTEMLPEIHENYQIQLKMADKGYWVYDFALPMLLLHGLKSGRTDRLIHWLHICPRKQFTTLDTHDGIGVVDVAGLLTEEEINFVREDVEDITKEARQYIKLPSMIKTSDGKFKSYQLGSTYYSALRCSDSAYLIARAVQFFAPGIPQIYYVGLLAGENDIESMKTNPDPRTINRHTFTRNEIENAVQKPVCQSLYKLMRFRNTYEAFNGKIHIGEDKKDGTLSITWEKDIYHTTLNADFKSLTYCITYYDKDTETDCTL